MLKIKIVLSLICISILPPIYSHTFTLSIQEGYRQDKMHWNYENGKFFKSIDEDFPKIKILDSALHGKYSLKNHIFLDGKLAYGFGTANTIKDQFILTIENNGDDICSHLEYKANSHLIDTQVNMGPFFQFGPLHVNPYLGFLYNLQKFKRKNNPSFYFQHQTPPIEGYLGPQKKITHSWQMGVLGLNLIFEGSFKSSFRLSTSYEFHVGKQHQKSSYFLKYNTQELTIFSPNANNITEIFTSNSLATGHMFNIQTIYQLFHHWIIGADFKYHYHKTKPKRLKTDISNIEKTSFSSSLPEVDYKNCQKSNKLSWQSFQGKIFLSYQL